MRGAAEFYDSFIVSAFEHDMTYDRLERFKASL